MGGAGTDTALETADVALMGDDLKKLPFIVNLSRKTLKIIKQNITFSLGIKLLALLLVLPGWLTLWIAIVADMGYASGLHREVLFTIGLVLFAFIMIINVSLNGILKKGEKTK